MSIYLSNLYRRTFFVITSLIILFAGFTFLPKSAEMQSKKVAPEQVFSPLKKLSYSRMVSTFGAPQNFLHSGNADGTGRQTLSNFVSASYTESTWLPDGTKVAFVTVLSSPDILVVNADGTNQVPLANDMTAAEKNPSWSVTGKIAYERDDEIWTMNGDGSNQALFTGISQTSPKAPKWSPDGSKLAFTSGGEI